MGMATAKLRSPVHKLRWFQYSLRSLMLLVLLVSLGMSWVAAPLRGSQ